MRPLRLPAKVHRVQESRFWSSFHHAFDGIVYATRTQRNMRIHLLLGAIALFATLYLRLDRAFVAIICVTVVIVIALELVNTAIESVVDLMTVAHHPLAKIAKDTAAGAVLVVSIGAVVVGYLTFYEGLTQAGDRVYVALGAIPANLVFVTLALVAIATVFAKAFLGRHGSALQGGAVSGHAALAFAGATMIALLSENLLVAILGYFLAVLVSQSRVEGGIHRPFEVVFGAVLGIGMSAAIVLLIRQPHVL